MIPGGLFPQAKMYVRFLTKQTLGICITAPLRPRKHHRETKQNAHRRLLRNPRPAANGSQLRRALNAVFEGNARLRVASSRSRLAAGSGAALIFASSAGGVGKTTLCATVARVLSSRLSNVLVADRCSEGIIPYYFSLERLRAGGLQTVYPNARRAGYQMTMVNAPCDEQPNTPTAAWLEQLQTESSLTLMDLPTLNGHSSQTQLVREGQVVVPLVPDVQSIASLARVEELSGMLARRTEWTKPVCAQPLRRGAPFASRDPCPSGKDS